MTFNTSAQKISTKPNKNTFQIQTGESEDVSFEGALRRAYLHPSMTVAEIGGSPALKMLAQRVRQVHAIIASPSQLSTARGSLAEFNNITFHHGDAFSLPLNDGSVDALFAFGEPQLDPDPPAAIREMARLLRPGGRLVMNFGGAQEQTALRAWLSQAGLVNVIVTDNTETGTVTAVGAKKVEARQGVRAAYAARALASDCGCGGSDCCSPSAEAPDAGIQTDIIFNSGYSAAEMDAVPQEAAALSLGCGNPGGMAAIQAGDTVLDIGSGAGMDAFLAAKRVGASGRVIGIDMTPAMLNRARTAAEKNGISNVEFRLGYAERMPLEDASVDVILSNCVINLVEDKGAVFQKAARVLKPGGRLEVNDMVFAGAVPPTLLVAEKGWSSCVSGALPEEEYVELVRQAGFTDIRVARSTSGGVAGGVEVYSIQLSARKPAVK